MRLAIPLRREGDLIIEAFKPWYETTVAIPTDPNLLHDLASKLLALQVLDYSEALAVAAILADRSGKAGTHGQVYALLAPAVERFNALDAEAQDEVRSLLDQYVRAYSFLSQVVDFGDVSLEALFLAAKALIALLPSSGGGRIDLGSEVVLTHLHQAKTSEGSLELESGVFEISAIYDGKGPRGEEEKERLSAIIKVLNDLFGTDFIPADQLFFDQMEESWVADEALVSQAKANTLENFRLVFADTFMKTIVHRMDDNADIFQRILDDREFQTVVMDHYLRRVFERARSDAPAAS